MAEVNESASTSASYGGVDVVEAVDDVIFSTKLVNPKGAPFLLPLPPHRFLSFLRSDPLLSRAVPAEYLPLRLLVPCL